MRRHSRHNPVCYHGYATRTCGPSNRTVRSFWDNVRLTLTGDPRTVRNPDDCARQRGRELAWKGRVNRGEPRLNVGRPHQPKTRTGWSQNGTWLGVRVPPSLPVDVMPPANRRDLPHSMIRTWNVISPPVARKGKPPVREADRRGGRGGGRKRRPLCNGADRSWVV